MDYKMVFMHAPSVYDFRNRDDILFAYLSNSDSVHVSPIFEMPPIGMLALYQHLKKNGFNTEFFNIAAFMLRYSDFNFDAFIKNISTEYIGIDLHWLAHVHGALELARLIKEYHPSTKIVLGGISSTYYHEELILYPQIDYVVRGYDTLEPVTMLVKSENNIEKLSTIPNLTWKTKEKVIVNPLVYTPLNYSAAVNWKEIFKDNNSSITPYNIVIPYAGCEHSCKTCGGSSYFFRNHMNVNSIRKKTPELISNEIQSIIDSESNGHTVTMINFWHQHRDLADVVSNKFEQQKINAVHFSLHDLPDIEIFRKQVKPVKAIVELSADTHDLSIGKKIGRGKYSMDEMEHFIDKLADDVYFFEIYFMIGLPYQSKNSVLETVAYCDYLMNKYKKNRNVIPYICPMLPFLDPGSEAAEKPETFGITLFHKTIEDHRKALTNLNWKYRLNFETSQMSRSELVDVSYEAVKKLTIIKNSYGLLPDCISNQITTLIDSTCELLNEIQLFESLTDEEQKTDFEIKIKEKVLAYNDEIFKKVRSQQRPLDFGFAKRQWFDTDDAINKILKTSMN